MIPTPISNLVYDGTVKDLIESGYGTGTMKYSLDNSTWSTEIPSTSNAGTYTVYYKTDESANYNESTVGSLQVTINKVTPIVIAPTAKVLTFNGAAQELVNAGSTNWGTLQYSTDNENWETSVPTKTNAGDYTVYYKVVGNSNINDIVADSVSVSIAKTTPTYTAPTAKSLTYNGSVQELINAGSTSDGTIQYSSDNSTWSTTIPTATDANTYTSYWRIVGDSNHVNKSSDSIDTTIAKATGEVTIVPTARELIYNDSDQQLINAGSGTGTMLYKLGNNSWTTSIPTASDANEYVVYYKAAESANYNESLYDNVVVTIGKVTPTVTTPTPKTLTYNGNPQNLVNAGSTNYGTIQYSLDNSTYSTNVPSSTNAGDYTVYYKVVGNVNINDVAPDTVTVSIAKDNPIYTSPTAKSGLVYNGSAQNILNAGSTSHGTIQYSSDNSTWSTTIPTATNVATYNTYWRLVGDSNHNDVSSTNISGIVISKVTPTVTIPTAKVLTYNTVAQALANDGSVDFGTIQYSLDNSSYSTTMPTAINVGTYTLYYKVIGDSNVNNVATDSIECMIAEKRVTTPTITLDQSSYTYSGNQCKPTPTVKDGTTIIPTSEYTVTYSNNTNTGTATVTISDNVEGNYYISGTTTFTIDKVTPTVTAPTAKSLTYNGSAQALVNAGSTNFGSLQYCTTSDGTYSTTIPTQTNAGSYEVWYKVVGDSNVNSTTPTKVTCSIAKANGTVTVNGTSNTYDGSAKNLVTVSDNTGTMHYKVDNGGWSTTLPNATNAGSWTIYWYMDESSNYNGIASADSRYVSSSIAKASGSVSTAPTAKSLTYNGNSQELINAGSGTGTMYYNVNGGAWGSAIPTQANAGTYTVGYYAAESSNHNQSVSGTVSVTIAKVTPTVTAPSAKNLTYTGSAQVIANAGSTNWGTLKYSLDNSTYSTSIPSGTNATTYTVYYRVDGDSNINNVAAKSISVSIAKANQSAPTATGATTTYNTTATATASGGGGQGTLTWTNGNTQTSVGSKTTKAYWAGNNNYNASPYSNEVTLTMNKATGSVSTAPVNTNYTYNGTARAVASAGSGTGTMYYRLGTSGNFSTSMPTMTNAGSSTLYYYAAASTNYNQSSTGSITVSVQKASQNAPTAVGATTTYSTTATATASGGGGQGSIEWSNGNTQTSVGSKTTQARWSGNSNYNASSWSNSVTVQMNKANQNAPTATGATVNYGSTATATASGGGGQGSIEWSNGNTRTAVGSQSTSARWSGNGNYNASSWSNSVTLTVNDPYNGHDYIEIGGLKWATMNIGANSITDTGLYFQWGDTQGYTASQVGSVTGKKYFGGEDYKYWTSNIGMTKYNDTDGKTVLDISDDAARANWGGQWRMPTSDEMQSLINNTNAAWNDKYYYQGRLVKGMVLTDKTNSSKTLFFPACGICNNGLVDNAAEGGYYWSSSLKGVNMALYLYFINGYIYSQYKLQRYFGLPVRGVAS